MVVFTAFYLVRIQSMSHCQTHRLGLRHVRDDAVRDYEQDEVLRAVPMLTGERGHVPHGGGEVGGAVEVDAPDARLVGGEHAGDALAERVGLVPVDEEEVRDDTVRGQARPKAQNGEQLVRVVVLDDVAHSLDGLFVLVGPVRADEVQRAETKRSYAGLEISPISFVGGNVNFLCVSAPA